MERTKYNLIQIIGMLKTHPKMEFSRVNDSKFIVYRGNLGGPRIPYRRKPKSERNLEVRDRILPIFNYLQDYFVINWGVKMEIDKAIELLQNYIKTDRELERI